MVNNGISQAATKRDRRRFLASIGGTVSGLASFNNLSWVHASTQPTTKITDVQISEGVTIVAASGAKGSFKGSRAQDLGALKTHLGRISELLIGRDPLDRTLSGEMLWEVIYPGKAQQYAQGRDPLTGERIVNKAREGRHTKTGRVFMAFSTADIALWEMCGLRAVRSRVVRRHFRMVEDLPTRPTILRSESCPAHHQSLDRSTTLRRIAARRALPAARIQLRRRTQSTGGPHEPVTKREHAHDDAERAGDCIDSVQPRHRVELFAWSSNEFRALSGSWCLGQCCGKQYESKQPLPMRVPQVARLVYAAPCPCLVLSVGSTQERGRRAQSPSRLSPDLATGTFS